MPLTSLPVRVLPETSDGKALTNWAHRIFMMGIAVARQYVHFFVGMFTNGARPRTPLTVHWEPSDLVSVGSNTRLDDDEMLWARDQDRSNIPAGVPHKVSGDSGASWEGRVLWWEDCQLLPRIVAVGEHNRDMRHPDSHTSSRGQMMVSIGLDAFVSHTSRLLSRAVSIFTLKIPPLFSFRKETNSGIGFELPLNSSHLTQRILPRSKISHNDMTMVARTFTMAIPQLART